MICGQEGEIMLVYFLEAAKPSLGLSKVSGIPTKCEEWFCNYDDDCNRYIVV